MIYAFRPVNLLSLVCLFAHFCIVPYDNMDNLLSLSRKGDMTSSLKGIVDNLSMTYDGNMLASVSDSAPAPSVTGSADFRDGASQPYRFLGNELYTSNSLGLYDFSARMYDPTLGRFLSVDPMAEGYRHLSPYAYCAGNPVVYADKDGKNMNGIHI